MGRIDFFHGNDIDLFLFGRTLAGLYAQPHTSVRLHRVDWIKNPLCAALEADGLRLAIEVSDHSDLWDFTLLEWCDVYAKRNIHPNHITELQHKITPFGLNWACHSRRSLVAALLAVSSTLPRASKARLMEIYRYLATPHWRAFEHGPELPVDKTILFQTRVWAPEEAPGDEIVNEQRIGLLRALRREFGPRVVGGVVPTPFALKNYPELITNQPCRHPQYVRWAKRPLIGIYFRGLFGAIAIKMAEFLAASKCIVSEPIHNVVADPLDFLSICRSTEECLAACELLLTDRTVAECARRSAWTYYQEHVRPEAHIRELLARARAVTKDGQAMMTNAPIA